MKYGLRTTDYGVSYGKVGTYGVRVPMEFSFDSIVQVRFTSPRLLLSTHVLVLDSLLLKLSYTT
jgi:hypothetical protein